MRTSAQENDITRLCRDPRPARTTRARVQRTYTLFLFTLLLLFLYGCGLFFRRYFSLVFMFRMFLFSLSTSGGLVCELISFNDAGLPAPRVRPGAPRRTHLTDNVKQGQF